MIKKFVLFLVLLLIISQFFRPEKNISAVTPVTDFIENHRPPENIQVILKTACYDCHSNNTVYPWYAEVSPLSWWLANHIKEGKEELNFSSWQTYSDKKKNHKLEEMVELVEKKEMPLKPYTLVHSDANLTQGERDELANWIRSLGNN